MAQSLLFAGAVFRLLLPSLILASGCFVPWVASAAEIPFESRVGLIQVKVSVAGSDQPLTFVLDSGAGATLLDLQVARSLGLKEGRRETIHGVNGLATASWVSGFQGMMGLVSLPHKVLALDLRGSAAAGPARFEGLLGADFFNGRIVQIDFHRHVLRILVHHEPGEGATVLAMRKRQGIFCVPLAINGIPNQWIRVDTGCSDPLHWCVTRKRDRASLRGTSVALAGSSVQYIGTEVELGAVRVSDVSTALHGNRLFAGESGLLGNGFLSRFRVTIDATRNRLVLE